MNRLETAPQKHCRLLHHSIVVCQMLRPLHLCSQADCLQGVNAQDQVLSTIMYQNYNYTTKSVGYSICDTKNPIVGVVPANMSDNVMTQVDQATALGTTSDAPHPLVSTSFVELHNILLLAIAT